MFLISNWPWSFVTAKNGWFRTAQYAPIHLCTSHLNRTGTSAWSNFLGVTILAKGWPMLNSVFFLGRAWMLWSVESLFRMFRVCPTWMPKTCGEYWQLCWSSVTGSLGGG